MLMAIEVKVITATTRIRLGITKLTNAKSANQKKNDDDDAADRTATAKAGKALRERLLQALQARAAVPGPLCRSCS